MTSSSAIRLRAIFRAAAVCCCIFGMVFQVYFNTEVYLRYSTTSQFDQYTPLAYPPMLYCPSTYIDYAKAAARGLSVDDVLFIDSYLLLGVTNMALMSVSPTLMSVKMNDSTYLLNQTMDAPARVEMLKQYMTDNNITTANEYFDGITRDSHELVSAKLNMVKEMIDVPTQKKLAMYGMCAQINFDAIPLNIFELGYLHAELFLHNQTDDLNLGYQLLFIGSKAKSIMPSGKLELRPRQSYTLTILQTQMYRISTKYRPCRDYTEANRSLCLGHCVNEHICGPKHGSCLQSIPHEILDPENNCNFFYGAFRRTECVQMQFSAHSDLVTFCYEQFCPAPCEEMKIDVTMNFLETAEGEEETQIHVRFDDPKQQQKMVQSLSVPLNTYLSNLGGSISLWCGASIILIVDYSILLVAKVFDKKTKTTPLMAPVVKLV